MWVMSNGFKTFSKKWQITLNNKLNENLMWLFSRSLKVYPMDTYLSLFCGQKMQCAVDGKRYKIKYI